MKLKVVSSEKDGRLKVYLIDSYFWGAVALEVLFPLDSAVILFSANFLFRSLQLKRSAL